MRSLTVLKTAGVVVSVRRPRVSVRSPREQVGRDPLRCRDAERLDHVDLIMSAVAAAFGLTRLTSPN